MYGYTYIYLFWGAIPWDRDAFKYCSIPANSLDTAGNSQASHFHQWIPLDFLAKNKWKPPFPCRAKQNGMSCRFPSRSAYRLMNPWSGSAQLCERVTYVLLYTIGPRDVHESSCHYIPFGILESSLIWLLHCHCQHRIASVWNPAPQASQLPAPGAAAAVFFGQSVQLVEPEHRPPHLQFQTKCNRNHTSKSHEQKTNKTCQHKTCTIKI